jgi:teichuronic acid exporter
MPRSLKDQTITGLAWSFLEKGVNQLSIFVTGVILARLLSPAEFGLIGMLSLFMAVSHAFIYSGFGEALIRNPETEEDDFSTVFVFNIVLSVIMYMILTASSPLIASFFNQNQLQKIIPLFSLILIIDATSLVPRTIVTKALDFKSQIISASISSLTSGIVAIYFAYNGFGVWALVIKALIHSTIQSSMLWVYSKWHLSLFFNRQKFKSMFAFSSKLLLSGLLNAVHQNILTIVIGKYFSATDLGFFKRAKQFQQLTTTQLDNAIQRVSYPVLAQIQNNNEKLRTAYRKLIKNAMLISVLLSTSLSAMATPVIHILLGSKWAMAAEYLEILAFAGVLYPLHSLNLNILNLFGRSDLYLKLSIIKKLLIAPMIIMGILYGIKVMLFLLIINSIIDFFLDSHWAEKYIGYGSLAQLRDLRPEFLIGGVVYLMLFGIKIWFPYDNLYFSFIAQLIALSCYLFILIFILKLESFTEIRNRMVAMIKSAK